MLIFLTFFCIFFLFFGFFVFNFFLSSNVSSLSLGIERVFKVSKFNYATSLVFVLRFPTEGGVSRGGRGRGLAYSRRYRLSLAFLVISVLSRYASYKNTWQKNKAFFPKLFQILSDEFSSGFYFLTKKEKTKEFMFILLEALQQVWAAPK